MKFFEVTLQVGLLQALAHVGFTASYLKRIVIDVSYHNYQETSSFWENSLVRSP